MKTLIKEIFVTIRRSLKRFVSILLIVLLGVGFFAGIKATSPDMELTVNKYYNDNNFMDLNLLSSWGITKDEINKLKDKNYDVEGSYSFDVMVKSDTEEAVKVLSYNKNKNINKLVLLEGKLPENNNECVIETNQYTELHKIGDKITIENDNIKNKDLTIVGIVKSPIYISLERGSTKLSTGRINYFIYINENNFKTKYYTEANIVFNYKNKFDKNYDSFIKDETKKLESITNTYKEDRYNEEVKKATDKVNDSIKELNSNKSKFNNEIKSARNKINDAKSKYKESLNKLNTTKNDTLKEINNNIKDMDNKLLYLNTQKDNLNLMKNEYTSKQSTINEMVSRVGQLNCLISTENSKIDDIDNSINNLDINDPNYSYLLSELNYQKNLLTSELGVLTEQRNKLTDDANALYIVLTNLSTEIYTLEQTITVSETKLDNGKDLLLNKKTLFLNGINEKEKELAKLNNTIKKNENTLNNKIKDTNKKLNNAEIKINNVKNDIKNIEKPEWYILDRNTNLGYYQFSQDIDRIANLGAIFPLVFFVVAVLICLTSMTRMVEEERNQLGTLKSLGFTDFQILFKYILYALIATITGSVIGLLIGFKILPDVIFNMYSMMYNIGSITTGFNIFYAVLGTLTAVFCTLFATLTVCIKSLKEQPSELMRPKSIRSGKRILLEKIKFLWKRLSFNRKVTMRNVFRYKKRMIMTIVGVSGCTGLIIAGFGLKDCITGMVSNQYEKVFNYELEITLAEDKNNNDIYDKIKGLDKVNDLIKVHKETVELDNIETNQTIQLVVPFSDINSFIKLQDRRTKEEFKLNDKVIISEKLSKLLDIDIDDELIIDANNNYKVKVDNITENYMYHFIYMNKDNYNSNNYNTILVKTDKMNDKEEKIFADEINKINGISKLNFTSSMANVFDKTMKNFEYVVVVLIVSANLLAFVVLYNLASVNISERKRELATIKVLGFFDKEVYNYIGRETTILTFISMFFGVIMGKILTTFIIKTCELDMIMFNPSIKVTSYIYGILITIVFTIIVNITTYFSLKKIEMIESLKSVE